MSDIWYLTFTLCYSLLISTMCATLLAHLILLDLFFLVALGEEYKL